MATADEIVIIILFVASIIAFAVLLAVVIIQWSAFSSGPDKWRRWLLQNPDKAPVKANKWIPIMNRAQIEEAADSLEVA